MGNPMTRWLALLVLVAPLLACSGDGGSGATNSAAGRIEGTVLYRERMMLPPGAELSVQLEDISRPDALAEVLAVVSVTPQGGPPFAFAIDYEAGVIDPRRKYALRASITVDGQLLFSTAEYTDPFQDGTIEMVVERVRQSVPQ